MAEKRPYSKTQTLLRDAGLRLTKQRVALGRLLLDGPNRHVTAESFHEEAESEGIKVSLATVYNTLHQFTDAGLLRQVAVDGSKTYFDTNTTEHPHFYLEDAETLVDIPPNTMRLSGVPETPEGTEIASVDVVVRLKSTP